jgi:hypothetical protein
MKNVVFWDIKTQFELHRRHIISPLHIPVLCKILGFHGSDYEECRRLGSHHVALVRTDASEDRIVSIIRLTKIGELETLAVTSRRNTLRSNVPSSPILVTVMMEEIRSSETSVLKRDTA